jgi:ATP:ADP antiporter, AAA family
MAEETEPRGGALDRLLRVFSDVRAGEGGTALLLLANLFLLLVSYYIFKTVREPLVLLSPLPSWVPSGAVQKSYAAAGQALVLMGFIPLYSWFSSRVDRLKLIFGVTIFFIVNIELFFLGSVMRAPYLGVIFYIWVGIFSLATIAQFWSFANDLYKKDAGERLFPLIAIGSTSGSVVGSKAADLLFAAKVSAYSMFHISAALLGVQLVLYWIISRRVARTVDQVRTEGPPLPAHNGFGLVFASPYLRLLALLIVLLNLVNTTGNYIIDSLLLVRAQAAVAADPTLNKEAFVGSFYGSYYFYVNLLTVLIQAFVVSRIVKYVGLAGVVLALPLVAFGGYGLIAAGAGLTAIRWAKIAENAADYSIMNTARAMLWLPTSREEKYNAKQAVDTFFVRFGDVLSAVLVYLGTAWLSLGVTGFAGANLALVVVWLAVGYLLLKENRALASRAEESRAAA